MLRFSRRLLTLVWLTLAVGAAPARADWLVIPFGGAAFGGETTSLLNLESGVGGAKSVYGVAGAWISRSIVGVEAEFLYGPGFFKNPDGEPLLVSSHISALSGGLIVTLPLSVTRESLRPYVTAGLGTMQASVDYSIDFLPDPADARRHSTSAAAPSVSSARMWAYGSIYATSTASTVSRMVLLTLPAHGSASGGSPLAWC